MNKGSIFGLAGAAVALAIGGFAVVGGLGMTQHSDVQYMTDGPAYADLTDLTRASQAVAQVRILSVSGTYTIPFDNASAVIGGRPQGNPEKDKLGPVTSNVPAPATPAQGLLKTDFTVEVLDTVRGSLKRGDHITVSQLGGTVQTRRPDGVSISNVVANTEHDPLMQSGDEEVLFLNRDAATGKFFTTGGGAGRFKVQSNGTVTAVDHDSEAGRIPNGKPVSFLTNAIRAVN